MYYLFYILLYKDDIMILYFSINTNGFKKIYMYEVGIIFLYTCYHMLLLFYWLMR